jgi:antitoxin component of MazEF toxin-antitoxin module
MTAIKIRKVGNSLGVIFPKEIQDDLEIVEGDVIELTKISHKKLILENLLPHHSNWKFENGHELSTADKEWLEADLEDKDDVSKW